MFCRNIFSSTKAKCYARASHQEPLAARATKLNELIAVQILGPRGAAELAGRVPLIEPAPLPPHLARAFQLIEQDDSDATLQAIQGVSDADLWVQGKVEGTLLHHASYYGRVRAVAALLRRNPQLVTAQTCENLFIPLHEVQYCYRPDEQNPNYLSVTEQLTAVMTPSDLLIQDEDGNTSVHCAMRRRKEPVLWHLLKSSPDQIFHIRNKDGEDVEKIANLRLAFRKQNKLETEGTQGMLAHIQSRKVLA